MTSVPATRVLVLDMQPIDPPLGGGRLRLLGLYHALGMPTTYVGTYDWPGPTERRHRLSETLEEVDVPLSPAHFQVNEQWQSFNFGRTLIDTAFPLMARLSTNFVHAVVEAIRKADIVVFSHPWVYPVARDAVDDERQLLVYDAHNFEGLLRTELLDDGGFGSEIVKQVISTEYELARRADLILTCAREDAKLFQEVYGIEAQRLHDAPNGVFCDKVRPATREERKSAQRALGLCGPCAIFLGSAFRPNVDAVRFLCKELAPALPGVTFLVCGGVCDAPDVGLLRHDCVPNVVFAGLLTDEQKTQYLRAADLAVNPVFTGSGSNLKMFEFAAAGLPVVTTAVGARGIDAGGETLGLVVDARELASAVSSISSDPERAEHLGQQARKSVENRYAWEKISPRLGQMLAAQLTNKRSHAEAAAGRRGSDVDEEKGRTAQVHPMADPTTEPSRAEALGGTAIERTEPPRPFALMTSWGIRCGIAENSRELWAQLEGLGAECHILANVLSGEDGLQVTTADSNGASVERVWRYREPPGEAVVEACRRRGVDRIWVQYHTAFFGVEALQDLLARAHRTGLSTVVTLHDAGAISVESLRRLAAMGGTFVVHDDRERNGLERLGFRHVVHVPLGILDLPEAETNGQRHRIRGNPPVLGTFGFLRPHKGVHELIEATGILAPLFPSIRLLGLTAMYTTEESAPYLQRCRELIRSLDLDDRVQIRTDFLSVEDVIGSLRRCDIVVLPYHRTNEGASAAAQLAIASRRPVIVTRQPMFRSLSGITYAVEGEAPSLLAAGIATLSNSPILQEKLRSGADQYIRANSFSSVAKRYAALLATAAHTQ